MSEIILCDRCSSLLSSKNTYRLIITLQQTAGVLEVNQSDLKKDLIEEIEKTIEELNACDPKELEDDIHISFSAVLSKRCRDKLVERLKEASNRQIDE